MPGMRLFGKRCSLATDDFFLIGIIDSIIFLPWLGWVPVIYASYIKHRSTCDAEKDRLLLDIYLPGLCASFLMNWLLAAFFIIFSRRGTISDPEPRRHVVKLVYVKLVISALDVAWAIFGTVILVRDSFCDIIGVAPVIKVSAIFLWVATLVRLGMIVLFYDWTFSKTTKERVPKEYFTTPVRKGTCKKWNLRLQALFMWCTTPSEARRHALKTASELMALLACDLDLVASDVLAGLLLYRQKCLQFWKEEKVKLLETPPITSTGGEELEKFPPEDFQPWMNLQIASRYFDLGLGIFGWAWFVYRHLACGFCLLIKWLTCCFPFRASSKKVLGDNCCGCQFAGLRAISKIPYEDLVHVSFVDKVFEVPFFVTYDHETSAIVVTARGTMSMNDVLTDVAANFECMNDPGLPPGALCHGGMLMAAREIKNKLEENEIIDTALREKPDYQLVITGHSLGAAVSTILTLLYLPKHPNVRCYAFAPPPTVNKIALPLTFQNVFTVIYGNDSVAFLNYENIKCMVIEMVKLLKECKLPKHKVFMSKEKNEMPVDVEDNCSIEIDQKNNQVDKVPNGVKKTNRSNSEAENGCDSSPCVTDSVHVAGTIVHIRKTENGYRLKICTADEYKPLLFRPLSVYDHFPQFIQKSLRDLSISPVLEASSLPQSRK